MERHDARERARSEPSGRVGGRAVVGGGDLERPAEVVVGHGAAGEVAVPRELGAELLALGVREQPVAARVVHGVLAPAGRVADHVPRLGGHGHPVLEVRDDALQRLVRELDFVVVVRVARVGQDVLDDVVVVVELLAELHHPPLHRDAEQRVDPADEHEVRRHVRVDAVDHHRGGCERLVAVHGHDREGVLAHQLELDREHLAHAGHARPDVHHTGGVGGSGLVDDVLGADPQALGGLHVLEVVDAGPPPPVLLLGDEPLLLLTACGGVPVVEGPARDPLRLELSVGIRRAQQDQGADGEE